MDANLSGEAVCSTRFPPFTSLENQQSRQPNVDDDMNCKVIQIDRREVSKWTLSRARRAFDITLSMLALTLSFPIMCAAAIAVRFSSPGPILFQQQRMGRNGRVFTLYKFRSMRLAPEEFSPITVTGDSRITNIGRILRKYKLDELPQFWNVLRGEMSIVGPRPKLPHHEGLQMPFRPGITGPATLAFRSEEELLSQIPKQYLDAYYERFVKTRKAQIDMEYMQTACLKSDLAILWHTAASCLASYPAKFQAELPDFEHIVAEMNLQPTGSSPEPAFYS